METNKLRLKIGEHEFEAEGPVDVVQSQFAAFKELIASLPARSFKPAEKNTEVNMDQIPHLPLEKIIKVEGRVVSLTAKCESVDEAVMLVLLGQRDFRQNEEATGAEIMDGLKISGYKLERIDRILDKLSDEGDIITTGIHRGRRYRLSNQGLKLALQIAQAVIETVP